MMLLIYEKQSWKMEAGLLQAHQMGTAGLSTSGDPQMHKY